MPLYDGVGGVARNVKKIYDGVGGVAREVKKAYDGVGGVARQYFSGNPVGDLAVGTSVFLNVDGVSTEFLVVHQGNPDASIYDASCDGTWLLAKDLIGKGYWSGDISIYSEASVHSKLNGASFYDLMDDNIQEIVKQVKIPYGCSAYKGRYVAAGAEGLSAKIFLLSGAEVGFEVGSYTTSSGNEHTLLAEGAKLDFFVSDTVDDEAAEALRVAYYTKGQYASDNGAKEWYTRSVDFDNDDTIWSCSANGNRGREHYLSTDCYWRPAFILPSDTQIDENFNIIA